jgi:hypothetical protein
MREKHLNHLLELVRQCRELYHPLSIEFASCPQAERWHLLCYESSRELGWLRDYVHWMRTGTVSKASYWRPDPQFGWPEWPICSYLDVSVDERARRIAQKTPQQDDWLKALPLLPAAARKGAIRIPITLSPGLNQQDAITAFQALLSAYRICPPSPALATGRKAPRVRVEARMTALVVYRLRQHFSAYDALSLLETTGLQGAFSDEASLEKAKRKALRHLAAFDLRARAAINSGTWFFPFGPTLIF